MLYLNYASVLQIQMFDLGVLLHIQNVIDSISEAKLS